MRTEAKMFDDVVFNEIILKQGRSRFIFDIFQKFVNFFNIIIDNNTAIFQGVLKHLFFLRKEQKIRNCTKFAEKLPMQLLKERFG